MHKGGYKFSMVKRNKIFQNNKNSRFQISDCIKRNKIKNYQSLAQIMKNIDCSLNGGRGAHSSSGGLNPTVSRNFHMDMS